MELVEESIPERRYVKSKGNKSKSDKVRKRKQAEHDLSNSELDPAMDGEWRNCIRWSVL